MDTKIKLLIVDDNPEVTNSISHFFKLKKGFEIIGIAGDALEAIDIISLQVPDVIIMDLIMPNADGFSLLENVKAQALKPRPKVIIVSCLSHESIISRASALGADFYIVKPFSLELLYSRLVEVCNKEFTISNRQKLNTDADKIQDRIYGILASMGIRKNTKGHKYLLDCIMVSLEEQGNTDNLSRRIYPKVGLINETNAYNIEKTIRHTLQMAWEKNPEQIPGADSQTKPVNKRVLKSIVQQII